MTTLGIIGSGMIGGSMGIRARELGWRVIGFDVDPSAAEEARVRGAIDEMGTRDDIMRRADVIVIAAHISGTLAEIARLRSAPPLMARLIVDISSVKAPIVEAARGLTNFVATHPMAGRERSGPAAASRDVFEGKTWLYVPSDDRDLDWRAVEFIGAFGAIPVEADAFEHDRIVALTSHLPQVFATLFTARMLRHPDFSKGDRRIEAFMGPTARELQRLSRSSEAMWRDILQANHENIARELRALARDLQDMAASLEGIGAR
jgi:prephenate dehydrogenase